MFSLLWIGLCSCKILLEGVIVMERVAFQRDDANAVHLRQYEIAAESLQPSTTYEVRVSYPATLPLAISVTFADDMQVTGRSLLNTEKLMFRTDSFGQIEVRISIESCCIFFSARLAIEKFRQVINFSFFRFFFARAQTVERSLFRYSLSVLRIQR